MYLKVRVLVAQREDKVRAGKKAGELAVSVRAKAERGLANRRVLALLNEHLGHPEGGIRLVSGHTSPSKVFRVGR